MEDETHHENHPQTPDHWTGMKEYLFQRLQPDWNSDADPDLSPLSVHDGSRLHMRRACSETLVSTFPEAPSQVFRPEIADRAGQKIGFLHQRHTGPSADNAARNWHTQGC